MKKIIFLVLVNLILLSGCSGMPYRLKKTAENYMLRFISENASITEENLYLEPLLVDQFEVSDNQFCLTYEIGHLIRISTLWEKQDREWERIEIQPYTDNCNWVR